MDFSRALVGFYVLFFIKKQRQTEKLLSGALALNYTSCKHIFNN